MCLINYNKKAKKYKHMTYSERTMIGTWYNQDHKGMKAITMLLHKNERTIRNEIKSGIIFEKVKNEKIIYKKLTF